jgi:hypothetical protein
MENTPIKVTKQGGERRSPMKPLVCHPEAGFSLLTFAQIDPKHSFPSKTHNGYEATFSLTRKGQ